MNSGGVACAPRKVGTPPGRPDRAERGELGLAVEAVARLPLEGRRPGVQHPTTVALDCPAQSFLPRLPRRLHRREDPAAGGVELLVARAACAKRKLLDAVAAERRMRVAVDETGDRAKPAGVDVLDLAVDQPELAHGTDGLDRGSVAEHVAVLDQVELRQRSPA